MLKPIVVVGSINMDLVSHGPHLPSPGETVRGTTFNTYAGGKGANQAVAMAKLGYPVSLIGRIGDDAFGDKLLEGLTREAVDVSLVERVPGSSGIASISTDNYGQNMIVVVPGANDQLRPADVEAAREQVSSAGMVLAQLEVPLETICALADICHRHAVPFMLDPAPVRDLPPSLLSRVDWLTPNETEASRLLSHLALADSSESKLKELLALGPAGGILKLGRNGAAVLSRTCGYFHLPAFPVDQIDTTAAGDCFNAAFAVAVLRDMDVIAALRFAAAAAAVSVTRAGAQQSLPTADEVMTFLEAHPSRLQGAYR